MYKVITDANGYYAFYNVGVGTYDIVIQKNDVVVATEVVEVGIDTSEDVTVEVEVAEQVSLTNLTYTLWNSFLNMQNILELRNNGQEALVADVGVFASNNHDAEFVKRFTMRVVVPPHGQRDLHLNPVFDLTKDSYGFIEIATNHSLFDGNVSYYKPSEISNGQFDYAFAIPFANSLTGVSYALSNTYYPINDASAFMSNWLTVVNPNNVLFKANVIYYADDGSMLKVLAIQVPPISRLDVDGGHESLGPNKAGLIEIVPQDMELPYLSALVRYASDNSFAFGQVAKHGVSSERVLPITNTESRFGYFELANTLSSSVILNIKLYNSDGNEVGHLVQNVQPKESLHLATKQMLPRDSSGTLVFSSNTPQALVGQMVVYQLNIDSARLATVENSQALEALGTNLFGSYNLYLGMNNWLRVFNTSEERTSLTVSVADKELSLTLNPHSRRDIAIHEFGLGQNTNGALTLTTQTPGSVASQMLRVRTDEFITSLPVR